MKSFNLLILCVISMLLFSCKVRNNKYIHSVQLEEALSTLSKKENSISEDVISKGNITIDCFNVRYRVASNEIIADTIFVTDTADNVVADIFANHSLFLTIKYKGRIISDNYEIRSTTFDWIENSERFVLSPMGSVQFEVIDNTLLVKTGMYVTDTDWGYEVRIKISEKGEMSFYAYNADDFHEAD